MARKQKSPEHLKQSSQALLYLGHALLAVKGRPPKSTANQLDQMTTAE